MPELPEVEIMVRELRKRLFPFPSDPDVSKPVISSIEVIRDNGKYLTGIERSQLRGAEITGVFRRGKYVMFELDLFDSGYGYLVAHNAMSGYWDSAEDPWTFDYVEGKRTAGEKDVRVVMTVRDLIGREQRLRFHDSRLFGSFKLLKNPDRGHELEIGLEALQTKCVLPGTFALPEDHFVQMLQMLTRKNKLIKEVLLDQSFVAGIGNIYASESLHRAGIDPRRIVEDLDEQQLRNLHRTMQEVLSESISCDLDYPRFLRVYRRKNCKDCGTEIKSVQIAKRGSYFCPSCQIE